MLIRKVHILPGTRQPIYTNLRRFVSPSILQALYYLHNLVFCIDIVFHSSDPPLNRLVSRTYVSSILLFGEILYSGRPVGSSWTTLAGRSSLIPHISAALLLGCYLHSASRQKSRVNPLRPPRVFRLLAIFTSLSKRVND